MVGGFFFQGPLSYFISSISVHNEHISHFVQLEEYPSSSSLSWGLHLRRDPKDEEVNEFSSLLGSLKSVSLVEGADEIKVWDGNPSRVFSVKSFYGSFLPISDFPLFLVFHQFMSFGKLRLHQRFKFSRGSR